MTSTPNLAELLEHPERAAEVPRDAIPSVLAELHAQRAKLGTVAAILAARLALPDDRPPGDLIGDVAEVARIVGYSIAWVRHSGSALPGYYQPGGKGTRVAWSRAALEAWAAGKRK
jgi:hypothetical protein